MKTKKTLPDKSAFQQSLVASHGGRVERYPAGNKCYGFCKKFHLLNFLRCLKWFAATNPNK